MPLRERRHHLAPEVAVHEQPMEEEQRRPRAALAVAHPPLRERDLAFRPELLEAGHGGILSRGPGRGYAGAPAKAIVHGPGEGERLELGPNS